MKCSKDAKSFIGIEVNPEKSLTKHIDASSGFCVDKKHRYLHEYEETPEVNKTILQSNALLGFPVTSECHLNDATKLHTFGGHTEELDYGKKNMWKIHGFHIQTKSKKDVGLTDVIVKASNAGHTFTAEHACVNGKADKKGVIKRVYEAKNKSPEYDASVEVTLKCSKDAKSFIGIEVNPEKSLTKHIDASSGFCVDKKHRYLHEYEETPEVNKTILQSNALLGFPVTTECHLKDATELHTFGHHTEQLDYGKKDMWKIHGFHIQTKSKKDVGLTDVIVKASNAGHTFTAEHACVNGKADKNGVIKRVYEAKNKSPKYDAKVEVTLKCAKDAKSFIEVEVNPEKSLSEHVDGSSGYCVDKKHRHLHEYEETPELNETIVGPNMLLSFPVTTECHLKDATELHTFDHHTLELAY